MNSSKKLIVLGMDGLDPTLCEKFMAQGLMPHFKQMADKGTFGRLATSNPPQSPVAWSCFISGHNPGHHDVFDFVVRDPATYLPEIGMTQTKKTEGSWKTLMAGLSGPSLQTRRKGKTFWDVLGEHKIKSVILRCPVTFPAEPLQGVLLTGMGTPDIRGTQGIATFFSTKENQDPESHARNVKVSWTENKIMTEITGPKVRQLQGVEDIKLPLIITKLSSNKLRLELDGTSKEVEIGHWSDWFRVKFKSGVLSNIWSLCRFHLNAVEPNLELYMTPLNIDPQSPAVAISYPSSYAKEIFEKIGNFYTQGMPYDTWALNEQRLSEENFLEQASGILDENIKTLDLELNRFQSGFLFSYFGITDLVQHMYWRYLDQNHPSPHASTNPLVRDAIKNIYVRMDQVLGEVLKKAGSEQPIIVLSDHGFGSFRRAVHINSWLRENGFLVLKDNAKVGRDFFVDVDWSQTKAYSVGFGGIYINQFGREKNGVVYKGAETDQVKKEIIDGLIKWKDQDGQSLVKKVYTGEELYSGPYRQDGPDMYVGFNLPYRASWQTGLGGAPEKLIEDNVKLWSGDHLCDPDLVPGVIFSNQKLTTDKASLLDISPTILRYFNLNPTADSEGKSLLQP